MKGIGKRASVLAIVAVLAVAALGSAYTLWFEDVRVNAVASTSNLDAAIACTAPQDNETATWPAPIPGSFFAAYPKASILKDIGSVTILPQTDFHHVDITVTNAYPGYGWDCEVHLFNTAQVPWHLENMTFTVQQCDSLGNYCVPLEPPPSSWTTNCQPGVCSWGDMGNDPPAGHVGGLATWSPLFAAATNWEGCQVHNTNFFGLSGSLFLGINQSAKENVQYKISIDYQVNQWNESNWMGCGQPKPTPTP